MQAKYPSFSPYDFCENSPILFIDKEGKEIWIEDPNGGQPVLYVPNETSVQDNVSDYVKTVAQTLDGISNSGMDKFEIVKNLACDNTNISIAVGKWNEHLGARVFSNDKGSVGGEFEWSPESGSIVEEGVRHSPANGLLHELGHFFYEKYDPTGEVAKRPDASTNYVERIKYDDEQIEASGKYQNPSDKWIIENVEPATGEPVRTKGHGANYVEEYKAESPFSLEGPAESEIEKQ